LLWRDYNGDEDMKTCTIHDERPNNNGNTFPVMMLTVPEVPPFPDALDGAPLPKGRTMHAVIAASDNDVADGELWGWTHLDEEEKQVIGLALEDYDARPNRWYWCELWHQNEAP
jgi:hypothetical protein